MSQGRCISIQSAILFILLMALLSFNASAGCGRWVVRDNTDYLKDPAFDLLYDPSPGVVNAANDTEEQTAETTQAEVIDFNLTPKLDISGKWQVMLNGSINRTANLILIQSEDRVAGYGSIDENSSKTAITAIGFLSNESILLNLELKSSEALSMASEEYKISLNISEDFPSGHYEIYESGAIFEKGNATANRKLVV